MSDDSPKKTPSDPDVTVPRSAYPSPDGGEGRLGGATMELDLDLDLEAQDAERLVDTLDNSAPDALGERLVKQGTITRHQLFNALNESYRIGCTLKEALVKLGYVDARQMG